uniref:Uncharacterized protein n=1 Tax=Streptomyces autolyticus TaxID=75293 RepID=F1DGL7_9ACTN|nr:hypothetical protein [Streptomyces autolyticus]
MTAHSLEHEMGSMRWTAERKRRKEIGGWRIGGRIDGGEGDVSVITESAPHH